MPYTQADLDAIKAAIASGELDVKTADGKRVIMRSIADLQLAQAAIEAELASTSTVLARPYPRRQLADFSD